MRTSKLLLLIFAIVTIASAQRAAGWDGTGHEAVAAIAWDNMKPATQAKVSKILGAAQKDDCLQELSSGTNAREFFIRAATWPDVVRPNNRPGHPDTRTCTKFHDRDAHFFDHFWSGVSESKGQDAPHDVTVVPTDPPTTDAVKRLEEFRPLVACTKTPCQATPAERAHDLAWMLHLVGDINQPLHNAARVTTEPKEDEGDHGGNFFLILSKDGKTLSNLHSFWDEIIDDPSIDPSKPKGEPKIAYINDVIAKIQAAHPKSSLAAQLESGQFDKWSTEGFATAERVAYPKTLERKKTPSDTYRTAVLNAADEAIALAGYRLADLLDQMFK